MSVEYLRAYNQLGELVEIEERDALLDKIRTHAISQGDSPLAVQLFHLVLVNSHGEAYITRRSLKKVDNPDLYDKTVGGHVIAVSLDTDTDLGDQKAVRLQALAEQGESYDDAVVRESQEELGVDIVVATLDTYDTIVRQTDLTATAVVRMLKLKPWHPSIQQITDGTKWIKRERLAIYAGMYEGKIQKYQQGEVETHIMLTAKELSDFIKIEPNQFTYDLAHILTEHQDILEPVRIV